MQPFVLKSAFKYWFSLQNAVLKKVIIDYIQWHFVLIQVSGTEVGCSNKEQVFGYHPASQVFNATKTCLGNNIGLNIKSKRLSFVFSQYELLISHTLHLLGPDWNNSTNRWMNIVYRSLVGLKIITLVIHKSNIKRHHQAQNVMLNLTIPSVSDPLSGIKCKHDNMIIWQNEPG